MVATLAAMTTYASLADGPRDIEAPGMPRLVGPPDGRDRADDADDTLAARTHGRTPRPGRRSGASLAPRPGTASAPVRAATRGERVSDLLWPVAYTCTSVLTGAVALTLAALAIAGFFALPGVGVGLLLLVPALWGAWGLSRLERHRIGALLGIDIGTRPASAAPGWRRGLGLDENRLKALAWAGLHGLWGVISAALVLFVAGQGLVLSLIPLWGGLADGVNVLGLVRVESTLGMALTWLIGLAWLVLTPWLARGLASVDVALARWLIGADAQAELRAMSARVDTLTTTRHETLDSVEAERRRIERDLHDGPQQRLVSIAMNLGLARDALDRNPDDPQAARMVRDLLDEAHSSSKDAITEMRQVARGIVPPILTDRGLDAAVSALADRSPVPVTVTSRLPEGRLEPTVEAIAYFCVSEALTNIAKHADARRATVDLGVARGLTGDLLAVTVTDDGQGGAVVGGGSGLTGLRQRVAAVDGQVHVHSPVGSGTTVAITLPLRRAGGAR